MSNIKINGTTPTVIKRNGSNITKMYHNGTAFSLSQTANYNWYYNDARTLVVREKISDGSFRWYFNYYTVNTASSPFMSIPSNLSRFTKNGVLTYCDYNNGDQGQIGFYEDSIRLWLTDLSLNATGSNIKAIMESTDTGFGNSHTWEEPTFDPING